MDTLAQRWSSALIVPANIAILVALWLVLSLPLRSLGIEQDLQSVLAGSFALALLSLGHASGQMVLAATDVSSDRLTNRLRATVLLTIAAASAGSLLVWISQLDRERVEQLRAALKGSDTAAAAPTTTGAIVALLLLSVVVGFGQSLPPEGGVGAPASDGRHRPIVLRLLGLRVELLDHAAVRVLGFLADLVTLAGGIYAVGGVLQFW